MIDPRELLEVRAFADLADDELAWLGERATEVVFEPGDVLLTEGDPIDTMYAILEGELRFAPERGTPDDRVVVRRAGDITGMLPFSRLTHSPFTARAVASSRLASFPATVFPAMLERIPPLRLKLASIMVDRSREYTRSDERREKLMSLGKLSAGLAHELNNPAAAIQQRAEVLGPGIDDLSALALRALQPSAAAALRSRARGVLGAEPGTSRPDLDALARSDAEEALASWLEARGLPEPWAAAETFVAAGMATGDLDRLTRDLPEDAIVAGLEWLAADLTLRRLAADIADATGRIVALIDAVKNYSNMDRAPRNAEFDLRDGIRSTLMMLGHKLRDKQVELRTEFGPDTPPVCGNPAELNQVWTNLLDNAIDAVAPGGAITVRTSSTVGSALVEIVDDGAGIPAEILGRVFDPFFTTKEVGRGTGLGLDVARRIVERHLGEVRVESEPGRTSFSVRLPPSEPAGGGEAAR